MKLDGTVEKMKALEGVNKKEWEAIRIKKGEHDCAIKEDSDGFGVERCLDSWECQGARMCERYLTKVGWGSDGHHLTHPSNGILSLDIGLKK